MNGIEDVFDGILIAGPTVEIVPDQQKLSQFNISPASFQFQLQTIVEGNIVGSIPENEQLTNIRMIYPQSTKNSLDRVKNQNIFMPDGKLKPISSLASFSLSKGVAEFNRENLKPVSIVTARLNNRDIGSAMKEIQETINKKFFLPQGYHIEYGGEYAAQQKSFNQLLLILILVITFSFWTYAGAFQGFPGRSDHTAGGSFRDSGKSDCTLYYGNTPECRQLHGPDHDSRDNWRKCNFYLPAVHDEQNHRGC